jgi:hypothetical protein
VNGVFNFRRKTHARQYVCEAISRTMVLTAGKIAVKPEAGGATANRCQNPNDQIPNPNKTPIPNDQNPMIPFALNPNWSLGHWDFFGIWDLVIGISSKITQTFANLARVSLICFNNAFCGSANFNVPSSISVFSILAGSTFLSISAKIAWDGI